MIQEPIIFYDRDPIYGRALIQRLQEINMLKTDFVLFTEYESLKKHVESHADAIVIIEEALYQKEQEIPCGHILLLCNERPKEASEDRIFKYQPATSISKQIESYYSQMVKPESKLFHQTNLITVFSYKNDCINSLIAYSLGMLYAKSKKTLLINLELLPFEPKHERAPYNLSDLIYYLGTREVLDIPNLEEYIYHVGELHCISSVKYYRDLYQINKEDLEHFFQYLHMQKEYDVVIVVADFVFSFIMELFEQSSQIIIDTGEDEISKCKEQSFLSMLEYEKRERLFDKITRVSVPEEYLKEIKQGGDTNWEAFEKIVQPLLFL